MSKLPKRRLYAKLSSFGWREGWQNVFVFYGLFFMVLLGVLMTLVAPHLVHWIAEERPSQPVVEREYRGPN